MLSIPKVLRRISTIKKKHARALKAMETRAQRDHTQMKKYESELRVLQDELQKLVSIDTAASSVIDNVWG